MRKLNKPLDSPGDVFTTCISHVADPDLKRRLELCKDEILAASTEFELKAPRTMLHTILARNNVAGIVSVKEMEKVYSERMVRKGSPGRPFYDKVISMPPYGRCPLCGQRVVSTIDHHLPKAQYPSLVVSPLNLIPTCKDCNTTKLDMIPLTPDQETLHPYFDDIDDHIWLLSSVVEDVPAALIFYVEPPIDWSDTLKNRVKYHFSILKLAELYSSHAAEELNNIRLSLQKVFDAGGELGVRNFLQDAANSRAVSYKNSWQTAMYRGLADNDWFCEEGFNFA